MFKKAKKRKVIYCNNCETFGHSYNECCKHITSYGIICFRVKDNVLSQNDSDIEFLIIRRKNTISYIEFIRGRYDINDTEYICSLFNKMTNDERFMIKTYSYEDLWKSFWSYNNSRHLKHDFKRGKRNHNLLCETIITSADVQRTYNDKSLLNYLLDNTKALYEEAEWGFPKGRKNVNELPINCAQREFIEETNINKDIYTILDYEPFEEIYMGSNGKKYRGVYFIAKTDNLDDIHLNLENRFQLNEVSKIGWFTYQKCLELFRDYHIEKKEMLTQVYELIKDNLKK